MGNLSKVYAQTDSPSNFGLTDYNITVSTTTTNNTSSDSIPTAQSVYDTGVMSLPTSVKGVIVFIPDEAHHPASDEKENKPKESQLSPNDSRSS